MLSPRQLPKILSCPGSIRIRFSLFDKQLDILETCRFFPVPLLEFHCQVFNGGFEARNNDVLEGVIYSLYLVDFRPQKLQGVLELGQFNGSPQALPREPGTVIYQRGGVRCGPHRGTRTSTSSISKAGILTPATFLVEVLTLRAIWDARSSFSRNAYP